MPPHLLFALLGDATGSSRALRQLRALDAAGLRVEVVTVGAPRAPEALPAGATLRALPPPPGRGPRRFWRAHRLVRSASMASPAAVYFASDLYVLPALAAAARRHGGRLAYDARELYAALDDTHGRPWVGAVWNAVERRYARRADVVFTVSDAIADRLARRHGIARPVVVRNLTAHAAPPRTDRLRRELGLPPGLPVVLYQGLLRAGRGLPALVDAVRAVDGVALVVVGEGPLEAALRARARGLERRVRFLPFTPPDALPALTASADAGALLNEPITESVRLALPNKLFEYLAAGLPVLAGPGPELRRVVEGYDVGLVVDAPGDPAAVAAALRRLLDPAARARWGANAPAALAAHRWEDDAARFLDALRALLP